jgi:hypothetical protein
VTLRLESEPEVPVDFEIDLGPGEISAPLTVYGPGGTIRIATALPDALDECSTENNSTLVQVPYCPWVP